MRKQKPVAAGRLARAVAIVMLTVLLTCGLIPSAIRISGGTSGAVSLAWRVEGTANIVGAQKPGDGP